MREWAFNNVVKVETASVGDAKLVVGTSNVWRVEESRKNFNKFFSLIGRCHAKKWWQM